MVDATLSTDTQKQVLSGNWTSVLKFLLIILDAIVNSTEETNMII